MRKTEQSLATTDIMRELTFSFTLLVSSFLLFLVQPMIGRMILPSLGGTPAVWNGCVLFFQAVLLAGYAWAHYGPPKMGVRNHLIGHLTILALVCFLLPMHLVEDWAVPTDSNPIGWLVGQLAVCVGLPFFIISSSAPLLQRWFGLSSGNDGSEPWFLYAVSNIGSLAALISYPFLVERYLGLTAQGWFWTGGFMLLAVLFIACGWITLSKTDLTSLERTPTTVKARSLPWKNRLRYIALAAIPSSLMLGVTTVVSTEVGSFPLMWSIPLALYLLTFIFVFSNRNPIPHGTLIFILPGMLLLMPLISLIDPGENPLLMIFIHFSIFFVVAMVCHGELNRLKPSVEQLTEFYLMMSIGGVVGGAVNSLIAPNLFNSILEYPLMLVAACLVLPARKALNGNADSDGANVDWFQEYVGIKPLLVAASLAFSWFLFESVALPPAFRTVIGFGVPAVICLSMVEAPRKFAVGYAILALACPMIMDIRDVVTRERGFFGVNEIAIDDKGKFIMLVNGRTLHGMQRLDQNENPEALTYYHLDGPIGDVFRLYGDRCNRIAAVGLGVGSLAAYATEDQDFDFYEIDPVVYQFASNKQYFSYLSSAKDSGANVNVVLGDARIQLDLLRRRIAGQHEPVRGSAFHPASYRRTKSEKYQMMVMDAFGSDAVPLHLLTEEAIQLYLDLLEDDGLLVFHVSSKFIDFAPIGAGISERFKLAAAMRIDLPDQATIDETGRTASFYMVMSKDAEVVEKFMQTGNGWQSIASDRKLVWTDEHTNVLDVIRW
ncbi:hypothetical protein [Mariniblastus fucicola]|uniref:Spermidine synthase n=1 Tax=Mariniblastus fucicola TaxID=980251 RepID=A0A5B9PCH1_9BACT|nr:hypothetical protein [Mariniblastus fucicola]QEG24008.1 hypothetical protein MFFC18_39140 [Mariniblastus fucicola]